MSTSPQDKDSVAPDVSVSLKIALQPALSMPEIVKLAALAAGEGKTLAELTADVLRKRATETAAA